MKRVLILCRSFKHQGGVVCYINSIIRHYKSDCLAIEHLRIGKRPGKESNIYYLFFLLYDAIKFWLKLFNKNYALVHLNPSLGLAPLLREAVFLILAKLHHKKVLLFWHGWATEIETRIQKNQIFLLAFKKVFDRADASVVLASSFKNKLREWEFKQDIYLETTSVDDDLVEGFSLDTKLEEIRYYGNLQILFLSRLELAKGIIETIDAFSALNNTDREISLVIAGDGPDADIVKKHVKKIGNDRIELVGYISGKKKRNILECSHLMCFPTSYGEGLPVVILEAMAFGIPIITRPVGGIPDIFADGVNGFYVQSLDREAYSKLLKEVIADKESLVRISLNNYKLARERFLSSLVAKKLDEIYRRMIAL